jgi:hypothetical protein
VNAGTGFHVPGLAVKVDPTTAVPETVGTGAAAKADAAAVIAADGALVREVVT